ncbi:hypothetical protein NMY22_g2125 [Coprinellus aureogranulatus]|nr:hypothetical protein NMY22_g2125 [Coprinellus aureogranulatus]
MSFPSDRRLFLDLPDEVASAIVAQVNRQSTSRIGALKSCALVSHAFVRPAQAHIFETISFDISRTSRFVVFQSLCRSLLRNRSLGLHVRDLQVRSDTPDLYELHIPAFNAFRTMLGLSKFTFICGRRTGSGMDASEEGLVGWEHFARTVQSNLQFVFALPSLQSLELGGIQNFPSATLLGFMRLRHLLLDSHFTVDTGLVAGSATSLMILSSIRLKSLTLREVGKDLISSLASMLAYNPTTLKRLDLAPVKVVGVEDFASATWSLMRLGGRGIEEFEWEGVSARPHSFKPIDLGSIRNTLKRLTVSITYSANFAEPQVLTDLQALLRQISSPESALEVVTIKTSFAGGSSSSDGGSTSTDFSGGFDPTHDPEFLDEWSDLDEILSHKKSFKRLDRLEIEYVPVSKSPKPIHGSSSAITATRKPDTRSFSTKSITAPPSLGEAAYSREQEWWTDTACAFAERLAGTRAKGVVIVFGESKTRRRSWAVFEPRSPMSSGTEAPAGHEGYGWQPMRIDY